MTQISIIIYQLIIIIYHTIVQKKVRLTILYTIVVLGTIYNIYLYIGTFSNHVQQYTRLVIMCGSVVPINTFTYRIFSSQAVRKYLFDSIK